MAHIKTSQRSTAMLHTAFSHVIQEALDEADTMEVMANLDGSIWIEKARIGIVVSEQSLAPNNRERAIKLVASDTRESIDTSSPIISAELPGTGERFEGLLPPICEAPCFSTRKPDDTPFKLKDYAALYQHASDEIPETLIPAMLDTFLNSDTGFKRAGNLFTHFKLKENKSWLR